MCAGTVRMYRIKEKSMSSQTNTLTEGPLAKQIFLVSLPLALSNLLQVLFNMSDVAVVGRFAGSTALGAVGSTSTLVTLFTGFLIGLSHVLGVARTVKTRHQHVDAVAQTDEETGEQGDEDAGGAYRAEGRGACEPAHHSHVRHIKEHLQQIGQGQRQADQEDLFGQRALRQRFGIRFHSFLIPIFLNPKLCPRTPGQPIL